MANIQYRPTPESPWQKLWVRLSQFASEIKTNSGKTVQEELDDPSNALSLEEIEASTDLTGKIASAQALKDSKPIVLAEDTTAHHGWKLYTYDGMVYFVGDVYVPNDIGAWAWFVVFTNIDEKYRPNTYFTYISGVSIQVNASGYIQSGGSGIPSNIYPLGGISWPAKG